MEYKIIEVKESADKLQKEVNKQIAKGWELVGGVAVAVDAGGSGWWYYQAMVNKSQQ